MPNPARALLPTLTAIWIAVAACAWFVLNHQSIPFAAAFAAAVAVWIEASLYVATGFEQARVWFYNKPLRLAASALPAYLIYASGTGSFQWPTLLALTAAALLVSFWFHFLPASDWTDLGFLCLIAAGLLLKPFPLLFPPLTPKLRQTEFIGHLLWIRLAFWALLAIRKRDSSSTGFGFLPRRADWQIGSRLFLYSVPVFAFLLWITGAIQWKQHLSWSTTPLYLAGTFAGILWIVALSEDFLVQGIFLPIVTRWTKSPWRGLAVSSLCFGLVHLTYRGFPNWRMVLLAGTLGAFCGRAVQLAGTIRAAMVTHALAVAVYRTLLAER